MHIPLVYTDGHREWSTHLYPHKIDSPLVNSNNALCKAYYQMGIYHSIYGPAVVYVSGGKEYCQFGRLHRIGGPAIENTEYVEYWEYGVKID